MRSASSHIKRQRKMLEVWRLRVTTEPLLRISTAVKSACQETLCARRDTIARNASILRAPQTVVKTDAEPERREVRQRAETYIKLATLLTDTSGVVFQTKT